jgi:cytochrome c5
MKILQKSVLVLSASFLVVMASCNKQTVSPSSLYTPTTADTSAYATLLELQQGRSLYINKCNACHDLYAPESYTPSTWRGIMGSMAPKTNMTSVETQNVTKYVSKGKQ